MTQPKTVETARVDLLGRWVTVRRPNDAQQILLSRHGRISQTAFSTLSKLTELPQPEGPEGTPDRELTDEERALLGKGLGAAGDMLDVIERLVVAGEDREWLQEQLKEGNLDLADLEKLIAPFLAKKKKTSAATRTR